MLLRYAAEAIVWVNLEVGMPHTFLRVVLPALPLRPFVFLRCVRR